MGSRRKNYDVVSSGGYDPNSRKTATEVAAEHAVAVGTPRYDSSNAKKSGIGVFVVLGCKSYLFSETARWRWKKIDGRLALEVEESGQIAFQAWAENVACVGGPQVLFRDAEWK